jgi:hypothetical protein
VSFPFSFVGFCPPRVKRRYELEYHLTRFRPTDTVNEETGETTNGLETWLWILIRRPVLSLNYKNTATKVSSTQDAPALTSILNSQPITTKLPPPRPRLLDRLRRSLSTRDCLPPEDREGSPQ